MSAAATDTDTNQASAVLREVAAEDPSRIAVETDEGTLSYHEFDAGANRLARRLVQELGDSHHPVALRVSGTRELAIGYLGIQRAGMIAVPVDPTAPVERVETILADVEAPLLLSDVAGDEELGLRIAVFHPLAFGAAMEPTPIERAPGEVVSIVYTSGSTGVPKGIMVGPQQRVRLADLTADNPIPLDGIRMGALTAGTVSHVEALVCAALLLRGTLVAYEIKRRGLGSLGNWLEDSRVVVFSTVPTVLRHLLVTLSPDQRFSSLRMVSLTGETSTWDDVKRLRRHLHEKAVIVNNFGLTETFSIASLEIPAEMPVAEGPLPVGQLKDGVELAIWDAAGKPVPAGERGEIVVRSEAAALGYWRRPELTRARFRELPDGRREVRTGDAGRLRADGTLEHLGRLDHQVQISGNRVELGEVEDALKRLDGIVAAATASYTDDMNNTRLAACVVPRADQAVDSRALRAGLSRRLPGYMVPDHIAVVDEVPRLPGGKVDRGQVAELRLTVSATREAPEPSLSQLERSLQTIWCEILQVGHVDRNDDFFEVGGDSIRATRLFVELDRRLGIDRPISLLAEAPTIASLASMLDDEEAAWNALLALRVEGSRPPLFVVHDGAGSVLYARGLTAELGPDQPVYGLRSEGLRGKPPVETSIEELAATYVRRIQALYPCGPYFFYGASLGGVISMEMARQLIEDGEEVPLVGLGDSGLPSVLAHPARPARLPAATARLKRMLNTARNDGLRASVQDRWMRRQAQRHGEPIPVRYRVSDVTRWHGALAVGHRPRPPFPERVLLLRTDGPGGSPDRGWGSILGPRLKIVDVPGTHHDLGKETSSGYVAAVLNPELEDMTANQSLEPSLRA